MTQSIQTFGLTESEVIRMDNNFYLTIPKIAEVLDTSRQNIHQIIKRNLDEFENDFVNLKLTTPILSANSVYLVCMFSRSKKAKEFRRVFTAMIEGIRKKEFIHISELENYKAELLHRQEVLSRIPQRKLSRYKKFRDLGMNRKELCKALELPYSRMKEADKILGYYRKLNVKLLPHLFTKTRNPKLETRTTEA